MGINNPGGGGSGEWVLISDTTLDDDGRFDISEIPQIYKNLYLLATVRSTTANPNDGLFMLFNNDSVNTDYHRTASENGAAATQSSTPVSGLTTGAGSPANYFSMNIFWILEYSMTNKTKYVRYLDSGRRTDASHVMQAGTNHWENTAAINQIQLQTDNHPTQLLLADSRLQVYGVGII